MAFSKRNSRPITIDGLRYRYCVSIGQPDSDLNFVLNITAQLAEGHGSKLRVTGLRTRDFWVDMPNVVAEEHWAEAYKIVTPRHMNLFITEALKHGWDPKLVGPPFEFVGDLN